MHWLRQFAEVEAGHVMSKDSLHALHHPGLGLNPAVLDKQVIPTLYELQTQIKKMKRGKAPGRTISPQMSLKLAELLSHASWLRSQPRSPFGVLNRFPGGVVALFPCIRVSFVVLILQATDPFLYPATQPKLTMLAYAATCWMLGLRSLCIYSSAG